MGFNNFSDELAVLEIVRSANFVRPGKLTSGQIYLALIRLQSDVPAAGDFMAMIDELVKEGLLVSAAVLDHDISFPYVQHIVLGVTETGAAVLEDRRFQADLFYMCSTVPSQLQRQERTDSRNCQPRTDKPHLPCSLCRA
ncbi:hypothetical protein ACQJ22_23990 [Pseudomonas fragariae (ex Marin et al. 2024)]|uniref:Phosphoenolpyruvate carboxykinase n=6 Tax=Pseudomonas TaxID=286 RepID=A0AAJ4B0I4_PSESX|nr:MULTISPECIES: hypothetical protein [Pseudomonas]MCW6057019.1 hypothetical protein [Pseudomonas fragi]AAY38568.1 hypothetical protein Psyr_3536 [Pseudomonas syringae pv. syringae B728a]AKF47115.1 hypothetical protein PsyrB_18230 [Pseudomonas syringae pv. syringae B301D]EGH73658.1 hypothetical protein PSYAR_24191 [Pseudomonas syringae pv. aceris str. M302273]EXL29558.1 hypothetical protein PssB301D_04354 [Pseudomonas syringae pv. syringae str. B301D-R]